MDIAKEKAIINHYNFINQSEIDDIKDIPLHVLHALSYLSIKDLVKIFIPSRIIQGRSFGEIGIELGVSKDVVRRVASKSGLSR